MFSCIVAGRPVITDIQTVSKTQFTFNIPSQPPFSHLVVFLLPGEILMHGAAAAVYIQIPPSDDFKLLGAIENQKQSAVFKLNTGFNQTNVHASAAFGDDVMTDEGSALPIGQGPTLGGPDVVVGISVEPADNVRAQLAATRRPAISDTSGTALVRHQPRQQTITTKVLAQRIIKNAFNFLSGFSSGRSGNEVVPLKSFQDWWTKFEKRIELDPSFLERDDQG